jgi:ParB/RepB/Spo0J family partition protein
MKIPLDKILPNPEQPRKSFDPIELEGLAQSIRENGVIQPVVVEESENGYYILHDGERRLRAAKIAKLAEIPAVINPPSNGSGPKERLVRALVANLQRAELNPIEQARAFAVLRDDHRMSISGIARTTGVSHPTISNRLKLLDLDDEIQRFVASGNLPGDKRVVEALLALPPTARLKLARGLALRHSSISAILGACTRLRNALQSERFDDEAPAISLAHRRAGREDRSRWDALHLIGKAPPWEVVIEAARSMCRSCSLSDIASETTCRECPGVFLLQDLIKSTRKEVQIC